MMKLMQTMKFFQRSYNNFGYSTLQEVVFSNLNGEGKLGKDQGVYGHLPACVPRMERGPIVEAS
jgi:hypothetical protein